MVTYFHRYVKTQSAFSIIIFPNHLPLTILFNIVAPKTTSKISLVKWDSMMAKNVYDLHRGLLGLYPLTTTFNNKTIKLFDIRPASKSVTTNSESEVPGKQSIFINHSFQTIQYPLYQFQA
jgi:methionyl-tRNA formyltransferase